MLVAIVLFAALPRQAIVPEWDEKKKRDRYGT